MDTRRATWTTSQGTPSTVTMTSRRRRWNFPTRSTQRRFAARDGTGQRRRRPPSRWPRLRSRSLRRRSRRSPWLRQLSRGSSSRPGRTERPTPIASSASRTGLLRLPGPRTGSACSRRRWAPTTNYRKRTADKHNKSQDLLRTCTCIRPVRLIVVLCA